MAKPGLKIIYYDMFLLEHARHVSYINTSSLLYICV